MQDRIFETLMLVRRYAADHGLENLTEEIDIALLVAAEELDRRNSAVTEPSHVGTHKSDRGKTVLYPQFVRTRRYH